VRRRCSRVRSFMGPTSVKIGFSASRENANRIRTFREREEGFRASKRIPNATGGAHGAQGGAHRGGLLCSVGRGDISGRHVFVVDERTTLSTMYGMKYIA